MEHALQCQCRNCQVSKGQMRVTRANTSTAGRSFYSISVTILKTHRIRVRFKFNVSTFTRCEGPRSFPNENLFPCARSINWLPFSNERRDSSRQNFRGRLKRLITISPVVMKMACFLDERLATSWCIIYKIINITFEVLSKFHFDI